MNDSEMTITLLNGEPEFRVLRRGDRCGLVRGDEGLVTRVRQFIDTGRAEFDDSVVAVPGNTFCVVERDSKGRLAMIMAGGVVVELDDGTRLEGTDGRTSRGLAEGFVSVWSSALSDRPLPDDDTHFEAGSIRGAGFTARISGDVAAVVAPAPSDVTTPDVTTPDDEAPMPVAAPEVEPPATVEAPIIIPDPPVIPDAPVEVEPPVVATPNVPPPTSEPSFQIFSLHDDGDPVPPPPPTTPVGREVVEGVRCSREHFNDPRSRYCAVCGISMLQTSIIIQRAERPALGVIIFADGSTETLDVPLVIGREPDETLVDRIGGRSVILADPNKRLSRVHAIVDYEGWDAFVRDDGSTNGTYWWRAGVDGWNRLANGQRHVLQSGDHIAFADVLVTFESGHQRS
jgi:hypothetical protein